jgi:SNF family Na+-dependent transporter
LIITYSSYLRSKDDVVLSGLAASSANEFVEVSLGGMISIPAAFVFLGTAGIIGQSTFALGFNVLPAVFAQMPAGNLFGAAFFFLLFLAAITSSLSMLQPGIAFLEESMGINRRQSCALLGLITALGCIFVVYNSKDLKALDTIDFWVGTFLIYVLATIQVILFGWVFGIEKGWKEAHEGSEIRIPNIFKFIIRWVSPALLLSIFLGWILNDVFGYDFKTKTFQPTEYVRDLIGGPGQPANGVAQLSFLIICMVIGFFALLVAQGKSRWENTKPENNETP